MNTLDNKDMESTLEFKMSASKWWQSLTEATSVHQVMTNQQTYMGVIISQAITHVNPRSRSYIQDTINSHMSQEPLLSVVKSLHSGYNKFTHRPARTTAVSGNPQKLARFWHVTHHDDICKIILQRTVEGKWRREAKKFWTDIINDCKGCSMCMLIAGEQWLLMLPTWQQVWQDHSPKNMGQMKVQGRLTKEVQWKSELCVRK